MSTYHLEISPRRVERLMWGFIAFFVATHLLATYSRVVLGHDHVFGLVPMFSLAEEGGIQTWYASLTLALSAALLLVIGWQRRRAGESMALHWLALGAIFAFLSIDEAVQIHEKLVEPLRATLKTSGALSNAWVIPYLALAIVVGAAYLPFLGRLSSQVRRLFVLAGALFVGGAAGMEMLSYPIQMSGLLPAPVAELLVEILEELGEMGGIAIFVRALLTHLAEPAATLHVRIGDVAPMGLNGSVSQLPLAQRRAPRVTSV